MVVPPVGLLYQEMIPEDAIADKSKDPGPQWDVPPPDVILGPGVTVA